MGLKKQPEKNQETKPLPQEKVAENDEKKKEDTKVGLFFFKEWLVIVLILIISLIVHLPNIGYPNMVVFDEVHFGGFLTDYINGVCFFDIHPPLAKMILAGTAKLAGYKGDFNFSKTETRYTSDFYIKIRLCPAILCSLASPLLTATLILQHCSITMAALCGLLFTFEFNQISQSRLIVTDGILYFFVALSIFATALEERYQIFPWLILQALAATCAFCTKFTAAGCFILIALSHIQILFIHNRRPDWFSVLFIRGVIVSVIFFFFLYVIMVIHLKLMPKKGYGDLYMQHDFRKLSMPVRVFKLLAAMYRYNANLQIDHPYQSKWYQWPFCLYDPLFVSVDFNARYIFLLSNPVASILSLLGFVIGFFTRDFTSFSYSVVYLISYAPFILVDRCVFNYHYEIPLMFGIAAFCMSLSQFLVRYRKVQIGFAFVVVCALLGCFAFWFPWIYGTPCSRERMRLLTIWPSMRRSFHL